MGGDSNPWLRPFLTGPGLFALAAVASGASVGILLQTVGGLFPAESLQVAILLVVAILLARPFFASSLRPPTCRWLVPRNWMRFGYSSHSLLFGACLGAGFATRITTGTIYLLGILAVGADSPLDAACMFAVFGFARALPIFMVGSCLAQQAARTLDCMTWLRWSRPIPDLCSRITVAFSGGLIVRLWLLPQLQS